MVEMRVSRTRMRVVSSVLLGLNACMVILFLVVRPALRDDGWSFLERQRPVRSEGEMTMTVVADGLNLALGRRAVGGWEMTSMRLYPLLNLPGYFASFFIFHVLQGFDLASSRMNSDIATVVFVIVAGIQWLSIAALCSIKRSREPAPN